MHSASVTVDKKLVSQIGKGVLVFTAVGKNDTRKEAESLAAKVLRLKMWDDNEGGRVSSKQICMIIQPMTASTQWKRNVQELGGEVLCGRPASS